MKAHWLMPHVPVWERCGSRMTFGSQSRCSAFRVAHFEWRLSPVAVFAVLGQEGMWDSARGYVGVQLQVSEAGNRVLPKSTASFPFQIISQVGLKACLSPPTQQGHSKNGHTNSLCLPTQYKDVHANPDSDCYLLQVSTLNYIFTPVVMGMTLTMVSNNILKFLLPCVNEWWGLFTRLG